MPKSTRQAKVLSALIETGSTREAARSTGISERQINRYLESPDFIASLREAERGLVETASRRLLAGMEKALDVLEAMMTGQDTSAANKRLAAVSWADLCLKWFEVHEIQERLTELEYHVYNNR